MLGCNQETKPKNPWDRKKWKMETKVIENEKPCSKNKSIFSKSNFLKRKSNDKHYLETNSDSMKELLHDTLELKSDYRTKKCLLENNTNLKAKPSEYHETSHEKNSKSQEAESKKCYASSPDSNNNFQPRSLYTSK